MINYTEIPVADDLLQLWLPVSGYIKAIIVSYTDIPCDYTWEIADKTGIGLYPAERMIYLGYRDTGKWFSKGLPNFDTSNPYMINFIGPHTKLTVRMISTSEE